MTDLSKEDKGPRPEVGKYFGFHHAEWWCGNAKQTADWMVGRLGFEKVAYRGLETGERGRVTHVVRQNNVVFALTSALNPDDAEISAHHSKHGDGVKCIAFTVDDATGIHDKAVSRGATSVFKPQELKDDNGAVIMSAVQTYGDTIHRFVQVVDYKGPFIPGYKSVNSEDVFNKVLPNPKLGFIDHCVGNMPDQGMLPTVEWYEAKLDFHRFWSVDDKQIHTEYSALRSIVMTDYDENVKMPINEPAPGKKKSQIQEYVEYYGGAGVQHIAINVPDVIYTITTLKTRGVEFLQVPKSYYVDLRERLSNSTTKIAESLDTIEELGILVDFDETGYLLQLFTKPIQDRPTFFFEFIQRAGHQGFGAGNFKALFEAIEREQERRGNLD
eukprot:GFYU01004133.1.p1 GENE.GFYU01004133.1~~GFYU01004133.1.p1  ORF type:complete len:385 (+),score=145.93 GFYU01004133.1:53-1207(+)